MALVTGFVLEKPRVGSANSPFTLTPDNLVVDQGAFDAAFPTDESTSRAEYCVLVTSDGDLVDAEFGWTKNDLIQRFDWEGRDQRYKTLPGGLPFVAGELALTSNTTRLKVPAPLLSLATYPVRLTVGGVDFLVQAVAQDADFTSPIAGNVQVSRATGNLHWNASDLTSFDGVSVLYQRQSFFTFKESTGAIGTVPATGTPSAVLTPIPGQGQFPLVRFGFGLWLRPIEVNSFGGIVPRGAFFWERGTGVLEFHPDDLAEHLGSTIYYDGVLLGMHLRLPQVEVGTVASPTSMSDVPSLGGDVIFRAISVITSGTAEFTSANSFTTAASLASVQEGDTVVLTSGPFSGVRRKITVVGASSLTVGSPFPSQGGAGFQVERLGTQFGQTLRYESLSGQPAPSTGQVAFDDVGAISTSASDQTVYGSSTLTYTISDLLIENGIALRLFRSPVDPEAKDPSLKDVSAFYPTEGATLADPLIGSPFVTLPIVPIEDPSFPLVIRVVQGTGSYPEGTLPRLDGANPSAASAGYTIDFEQRAINLTARKNGVVIPLSTPTGALSLPDPLIRTSNAVVELDTGSGYQPLVLGEDALLDAGSGVLQFVNTQGETRASGLATLTSTTLTDPSKNFSLLGVQVADLLVLPTFGVITITAVGGTTLTYAAITPPSGKVSYEVRSGREILADRAFKEVTLVDPNTRVDRLRSHGGNASNSPRQAIPLSALTGTIRVLIGGSFATRTLAPVATSGDFAIPSFVLSGTVQVALDTGELNFRNTDVGLPWKSSAPLREGVDYRIEPSTGFIQTTERLLSGDELTLTYRTVQDDGTPGSVVVERATFLVRKELATYVAPSSSTFNKFSRTVASVPAPFVYRGGRPQDESQIFVDLPSATITFLPDDQITDALPHGAELGPNENVLVDYYVYEAIGGENTTTALQAPLYFASAYSKTGTTITNGLLEGGTSFFVPGNRVAEFPAKSLLRVGAEEVYYLDTPVYSSGSDETEIKLLTPQAFRNSNSKPKLLITTGTTPLTGTLLSPPYFALEVDFTRAKGVVGLARGMNVLRLPGDRTSQYPTGTVLYLSAPLPTPTQDFYYVEGSALKDGVTEITLRGTFARQYNPSPDTDGATVRRSVRPILDSAATKAQSVRPPVLSNGFVLYRKVAGQVGQILAYVPLGGSTPKSDLFTIDDAGVVTLRDPLVPGEELVLLYTGYTSPTGNLRVSYTTTIIPNQVNGLASQSLEADFTAFSPDTFYYRVETLTNYRGEVAKKYRDEAKASVPSGGPNTSNMAQSRLQDQGKPSVFFEEGSLYNEDIIARATLKQYHDMVEALEGCLSSLDGRIVGDSDGHFLFDGSLGTVNGTTNQIDDLVQISPFPIQVTMPGFTISYLGTYRKAYEPGPTSRFFPTSKTKFGLTTGGTDTGAVTGDPILDFGVKNLTGLSTVFRRLPRALVAVASTGTALQVDRSDANDVGPDGKPGPLRPAFTAGMKVQVVGYAGPAMITSVVGNVLNLDAPLNAPLGATVTLHPSDSKSDGGYQQSYRVGTDVAVSLEKGELSYIKPYPPFDGSVPLIPDALNIQAPDSMEMLQANIGFVNTLTEPEKFPALYGKALNDDGDQAIPIVYNPTSSESPNLTLELAEIDPSGPILGNTTPEFVGVGTLNAGRTILTLDTGIFTGVAIQTWDLVFILSGANSTALPRRVVAVTANSVTVDVAFPSAGSSVSFFVARGTNVASGTITSLTPFSVTQVATTFPLVKPGHTLVMTSGPETGMRREVTSAVGDTINFTPPLFSLGVGNTFHVRDTRATFTKTDKAVSYANAQAINTGSIGFVIASFFDLTFTNVASSTGTVSGTQLTAAIDLQAAGVTSTHYVYIETGTSYGVYPVSMVTGNILEVDPSLPFFGSGAVSFRAVSSFGIAKKSLVGLADVARKASVAYAGALLFLNKLATSVAVATPAIPSGDTSYYARRVLTSDYTTRLSFLPTREDEISGATGAIETLTQVLDSSDRLYDKRFTWIDARINLEKGILPKQKMALTNRLKAQAETVKQLLKLLAVES